ncbi:MAG: hypothetical protein J7601_09275 [Chloroflexi bacterium]|nr:hypothetical protein [Chloroflexota bacterium]
MLAINRTLNEFVTAIGIPCLRRSASLGQTLPEVSTDNPKSRNVRKAFERYRGSSAEKWKFGLIGELAGHFKGEGSAERLVLCLLLPMESLCALAVVVLRMLC